MGNQSSSQYSSESLKSLQKYQQVSKIQQGVIYRQKHKSQQTDEQYYQYFLLKEHNYHNQSAHQEAFRKYQAEIEAQNHNEQTQANTLSIKQVVKQQVQHFCSNSFKIFTLYEYPELTLKDQILVRAKQQKYFQQCQLVAILQTCIMSLEQIRAVICFNAESIFISQDGVIKVLHNDLVQQSYRHLLTQNIYYAPQKLSNFNYETSSQIGLKKEIIFSIGMTLLEACCLQELYSFYDYDSKKLNEIKLQNKISQIGQKYSTDLVELLSNMLQINPNRRISILQVQRALNRYDQNQSASSNMGNNNYYNNQDAILNGEEYHQHQQDEMEKKCDELFYTGNASDKQESLTRIKQTEQYSDEPSVPNLISNQNSSRQSLNRHQIVNNPTQRQYSHLPEDQFFYKLTPGVQSQSQFQKNQTANFSTAKLSNNIQSANNNSARSNDGLFTDPKLLEMIRKDLQEISKSRTSRITHNNQNLVSSRANNDYFYSNNNMFPSANYCNTFQTQPYSLTTQYKINKSSMNTSKNYINAPPEYINFNNCPQVQSLAASVAMDNSEQKRYVYQQSEIKNYKPQSQQSPNRIYQQQYGTGSNMKASVALSTKNFSCQNNDHSSNQPSVNDPKTIRFPLKQVPTNINVQNKSFSQIQQQIKKDMMKKKEANLVYLEEIYDDGVKYEGMSKSGLKQGYGKLIYSDGAYYQGYFHDDKINGKGTLYYYKNKPAYDGQWLDEQFHGYGELYNQQPQQLDEQFPFQNFNQLQNYWIKYEGEFMNDNKHGQGKILLINQEYIEGQFQNDMLNGWGKFYSKNGKVIEGRWEQNKLVQLSHN